MKVVGITGGIGSGKTTVCEFWRRWGAHVFDSDVEAKRLMTVDGVLRAAVRDLFGPEAYLRDGGLNREFLARRVFSDPDELERLNQLVHPRVFAAFADFARRAAAEGAPLAVRESALMPKGEAREGLFAVVVVHAPEEVRMARTLERGLTREQVLARMAQQRTDSEFLTAGDIVIENTGSLEELEREARRVFDSLALRRASGGDGEPAGESMAARPSAGGVSADEPAAPLVKGWLQVLQADPRVTPYPELPRSIPRWGNALMRFFGRLVLGMSGFRFVGNFPDRKKFVLIGAPHTTNWDFVLGMSLLLALGLRVNWIGKHTIFRWPFGWFMRWLGGVPVDRAEAGGMVEQVASAIRRADRMIIGLAPEGTRKYVDRWKTGFYRIAVAAEVPIVLGMIDFGNRELRVDSVFHPGTDMEADMEAIQERYRGVQGLHPEKFNLS